MKTLINLVRRAFAQSRICSLELRLADETSLLRHVGSKADFATVFIMRAETKAKLAAARAHYNSLLPIGQRKTWRLA